MKTYFGILVCLLCLSNTALAELEVVEVEGRRINLVGQAISASQGVVGQEEIRLRPLLRTGEVLELVPGMVVTQHSGTGKANQYFLRGFNLDHGTEFSTFVDGMPINMRTHGHGQGYTDLNFIIPETIQDIKYKKGPYYADVGDFSGVGSADFSTSNSFDEGVLELTVGQYDYYRLLSTDSVATANGEWLYGLELNYNDGPWTDIEEDMNKVNFLLKYASDIAGGQLQLALMAYNNKWNSADQIPRRAVTSGLINEFGSLDDTVGGESGRYSLSANWQNDALKLSAYAINYDLSLWSNFTYFLDDEENGDQFQQVDKRWIYGGKASYTLNSAWMGREVLNRFGTEIRFDDIDEVGLYHTSNRKRLGVIRSDQVNESSIGLYWENEISWTGALRSVIGLRYDYYRFKVNGLVDRNAQGIDLSDNGGQNNDSRISPKASLIYTLSEQWEMYLSAGKGFHSNDARGTTINIDPVSGEGVDSVDPLVGSLGYEVGLRGFLNERLNMSVALWALRLDSELLFVGDAGTTEPSRESKRHGFELTAYYRLTDDWTIDLEYANSDARFVGNEPGGSQIPGAIENVIQAGVSADLANGWFGSLRGRFFGKRPLVEDGSENSNPSTVFNLLVGHRFSSWELKAEVLNVFDSDDHDIDYFYASRLKSEPTTVATEDIHYHILEPRTLRLSASIAF